jgi:hypothetical protein
MSSVRNVPKLSATGTTVCALAAAVLIGCSDSEPSVKSGSHEVKAEYKEAVAAAAKLGIVAKADESGEVDYLDYYMVRDVPAAIQHIQEFPNLKTVNFSSTNLGDAEMEQLASAKKLEVAALHGTRITDDGLAHLARLGNLKELNLNDTSIGDAGLAHLSDLSTLELLRLQSTMVTDTGLAHLANLKNLKHVWLSGSQVTEDGAAQLRQALPDAEIVRTEIIDTSGQPLLPASAFEDGDGDP